jgi:hypothetical protein
MDSPPPENKNPHGFGSCSDAPPWIYDGTAQSRNPHALSPGVSTSGALAGQAREVSWQKYTQCDPRPDASSFSDLHTYLSTSTEEKARVRLDAPCVWDS